MTEDITIPPEAVEAGARAICAGNKWGEPCAMPCSDCLPEARAALQAGLRAWPGMSDIPACEAGGTQYPRVIHLPLPQENTDAET